MPSPLLLAIPLLSGSAHAAEIAFLPEGSVVERSLSDREASQSSLLVRSASESGSTIEGAIGEELPIARVSFGGHKLEMGLNARSAMSFHADGELTFGLLMFDGRVGLPLTLGWGGGGATLEWSHTSAHYADGVRHAGELPANTEATSLETLSLQTFHKRGWLTAFQRVEWIYHHTHNVAPLVGYIGFDLTAESAPYSPYLSTSLRGDVDGGDLSLQIGGQFRGGGKKLRLALVAHSGRSMWGKSHDSEDNYLGAILAISP